MFLKVLENQRLNPGSEGIDEVHVDGDILQVVGWYESFIPFSVSIRLRPEQRKWLIEALGGTEVRKLLRWCLRGEHDKCRHLGLSGFLKIICECGCHALPDPPGWENEPGDLGQLGSRWLK